MLFKFGIRSLMQVQILFLYPNRNFLQMLKAPWNEIIMEEITLTCEVPNFWQTMTVEMLSIG